MDQDKDDGWPSNLPAEERELLQAGWDITARRRHRSELAAIATPAGHERRSVQVSVGGRQLWALFHRPREV